MMKTLTIVAVAMLALTTHGLAAEKFKPVAVYLAPPAGPFQDPQRIASTRDLRERLAHAKKDLRLVARPEDAVVIVEVLDRTENNGDKVVAAKLTIGEYTTTLQGHSTPMTPLGYLGSKWQEAALALATQIKHFIQANHQKLR